MRLIRRRRSGFWVQVSENGVRWTHQRRRRLWLNFIGMHQAGSRNLAAATACFSPPRKESRRIGGATDPHAALDWFQKKNEPAHLFAVENVILGWWQKDHTAAAAYVSAHVGTAGEREVAGVMADAMAEQDPRVATDW